MQHRAGFYEKYIKRLLDIVLSGAALVILSPVLLITAVLVRIKLGSPVMFTQERPSPMVRLPLWVLSKIPFKKDDMILRVRPAR